MSISIQCPDCPAKYNVPEEHAGKRTKCKQCGTLISIPAVEGDGSDAASPPPRPTKSPVVERSAGTGRRVERGERSGGSRRRQKEEPEEDALPPAAIAGAAVAALLCAAVWYLIIVKTGYAIGWLAIGVGAATGTAMVKLGGRGLVAGVVAAVLAAIGVVGGHVAGLDASFQSGLDQGIAEMLRSDSTKDSFRELRSFGREVAELEHPLTTATVKLYYQDFTATPDEPMTPAQITEFREEMIRWEAYSKKGGGNLFKADYEADVRAELDAEFATMELLKEEFDPKDILFLIFAIGAAFGIVNKQ